MTRYRLIGYEVGKIIEDLEEECKTPVPEIEKPKTKPPKKNPE
jgi:hypothetical protein